MDKKQKKHEDYIKNKERYKQKAKDYYYNKRKKFLEENKEYYKQFNKIQGQKKIKRWRDFLTELRIEKGGKCMMCNYNKEVRILQFHHLRDKKAEISSIKVPHKARIEAEKCILLCPNCHALLHLKETKI